MKKEIRLGDEVKDRVTQLLGIVIGLSQELFGEPRVTFQPREFQNGVLLDPVTVPLARVVFVQADALHLDIQALLDGPDPRRV